MLEKLDDQKLKDLLSALDGLEQVIRGSGILDEPGRMTGRELGLYLSSALMVLTWQAEKQGAEAESILSEEKRGKYQMLKSVVLSQEMTAQPFLEDTLSGWSKLMDQVDGLKQNDRAWRQYLPVKPEIESVRDFLEAACGTQMAPSSRSIYNPYNLTFDEQINAQTPDLPDLRDEFMEDLFDTLTQIRCGVSGMSVQEVASTYCEQLIQTYVETSRCLPVKVMRQITTQVGDIVQFVNGNVDWGTYKTLENYVQNLIYRD